MLFLGKILNFVTAMFYVLIYFLAFCCAMLLKFLLSIIGRFCGLFKPHKYWEARKVIFEEPTWFFGNLAPFFLRKQSLVDLYNDIYNKYKERYVGLYQFSSPSLLIRDPELIRQTIAENFEAFPDRTVFIPKELDPVWAEGLFALSGKQKWKTIRTAIDALFTGSKLRRVFQSTRECVMRLTSYIETKIVEDEATLDVTDTFTRVSNDIIARITLGVVCNSFENPNNHIFYMGRDISNLTGFCKSLKFFLAALSVDVAKLFRISFINKTTATSMKKVIQESIAYQEEQGYNDVNLIQILRKARVGQLNRSDEEVGPSRTQREAFYMEFTDDIILAQAIVFFAGGFDTLSRAISYITYELALNKNVQDRLRNEIIEIHESCNGGLDYPTLIKMKYLEMVVSEGLRKWPPIAIVDRLSVKKFEIPSNSDAETNLEIDKNIICLVPVYSIHRDPAHFPQPNEFNPERFNENNPKPRRYTYMPFGIGRRSCIGARFAVMVIKMVLFDLLRTYEIVPVQETPIPIVLSKINVNPAPDKKLMLGFKPV